MGTNGGGSTSPLEKWLQVALMPLVVATIGIWGTITVSNNQIANAKTAAEASIRSAEKLAQANIESDRRKAKTEEQLKVLEIFSKQIGSSDPRQRELAVSLLRGLSEDADLAQILAQASANDPARNVKAAANVILDQSRNNFVVIASVRNRNIADDFANKVRTKLGLIPEIYVSTNGYFAVTAGGYLSFDEARKRLVKAKAGGFTDAYVYNTQQWGDDLLRQPH